LQITIPRMVDLGIATRGKCPARGCPEDNFQCEDGSECIPDFWRCDSGEDCSDGSDELGCPATDAGGDGPFHRLMVTVKQARNLEDMDRAGSRPSDPYAYVEFTGNDAQLTEEITDTLNPEWRWNNSFEFVVKKPSTDRLKITLYDADVMWPDELGFMATRFSVLKSMLDGRRTICGWWKLWGVSPRRKRRPAAKYLKWWDVDYNSMFSLAPNGAAIELEFTLAAIEWTTSSSRIVQVEDRDKMPPGGDDNANFLHRKGSTINITLSFGGQGGVSV